MKPARPPSAAPQLDPPGTCLHLSRLRADQSKPLKRAAAQDQPKIEATTFSYDGKDFVRTRTTLVTEDGKSAVDTKLEHSSPAYKALIHKHSYVGDATVFGRKYDADYAPLTSADGKLTGALFGAVAK